MPASEELAAFIRSHFNSVWSLELLLHLSRDADRAWGPATLVEELRASEFVIESSVDTLLAGGLIVLEDGGAARYAPASDDLRRLVAETIALYGRKPDAVRRLIVLSAGSGLSAFAGAFKLRRD